MTSDCLSLHTLMTSDGPPHQVIGSSRGAPACPSCRTSPRCSPTYSLRMIGSLSWRAMGCGMWSMTRRPSRLHAPRREGAAWCTPRPPEGTSTATAARSRRRARSCAGRWRAARWTTSPSSSHGCFGPTRRPPAERRPPQRARAHREGRAASSGATECAECALSQCARAEITPTGHRSLKMDFRGPRGGRRCGAASVPNRGPESSRAVTRLCRPPRADNHGLDAATKHQSRSRPAAAWCGSRGCPSTVRRACPPVQAYTTQKVAQNSSNDSHRSASLARLHPTSFVTAGAPRWDPASP